MSRQLCNVSTWLDWPHFLGFPFLQFPNDKPQEIFSGDLVSRKEVAAILHLRLTDVLTHAVALKQHVSVSALLSLNSSPSLTPGPDTCLLPWGRVLIFSGSPHHQYQRQYELMSFSPTLCLSGLALCVWAPVCSYSPPLYNYLLFLTACPLDFKQQHQR